jgi:hypothetical protein
MIGHGCDREEFDTLLGVLDMYCALNNKKNKRGVFNLYACDLGWRVDVTIPSSLWSVAWSMNHKRVTVSGIVTVDKDGHIQGMSVYAIRPHALEESRKCLIYGYL